jgi:hypothetical protein
MYTMNSFHFSYQLQPYLAARFVSFIRRRNYSHSYASSQELTNRTHQLVFCHWKEI